MRPRASATIFPVKRRRGALPLFVTFGVVVGLLAGVAPAAQAAGATRKVIISKAQQPLASGAGGLVTSTSTGAVAGPIDCGASCTKSFSRYSSVTLTATPTADAVVNGVLVPGSTLVGFSTNCTRPSPTANTCTISSLASDTTVTVTFARKQALTVTKSGTAGQSGSGTVAAAGASGYAPAFVDCGAATCSATSAETLNSSITLTATADATSRFMGWSNACTNLAGTCTVSMSTARTAVAEFRRTYLLTAEKASRGSGAGTLTATSGATSTCASTCSARYISTETVMLTATPASGSVFVGWEGDIGSCVATASPCTVTMSQSRSITARFASIETLTVAIDGANGSVVSSPAGIDCSTTCSAQFPFGDTVTLTAASIESTAFRGWTGVSGCETTLSLTCVVTIAGAGQTATANFGDLNKLEVLQALTGPALGTVTATVLGTTVAACATACWQEPDTVVVLTASLGAETRWDGWTGDCALSGADDEICTVTLATSETVTANFVATHDLDLTVAEDATYGGSVTVDDADADCVADSTTDCDATYDHGTTVTLIAVPDADTSVLWTGDLGACSATALTCSVTLDDAKAITATFSKTLFPLSVTIAGTGSGSVGGAVGEASVFAACTSATCTTDIGIKDEVVLTATEDPGSRFAGWSGDCTGTGTCTLTMDGAHAVTATFTATAALALTVTESGGTGKVTLSAGTVTPTSDCLSSGTQPCTATYDTTESVTLTAVPTMTLGSESKVGLWTGDCASRGSLSTCTLAMSAARTVGITFVPLIYTLTVTRTLLGTGAGTVTSDVAGIACPTDCTEDYSIRTPVILTAAAGTNSQFMGWSGGTCTGTSATCLATMDAARTVTATFASLETLTVTKAGPRTGTVSSPDAGISCGSDCPSDTGIYPWGSTVVLTAVPDGTSVIGGWSINACRTNQTWNSSCSVTVGAGTTVTVTFNPPSYALSVTKAGTGSGSVTSTSNPTQSSQLNCGSTCSVSFFEGTTVTLTATASSTSYFDSWGGPWCSGTSTTCTVPMTQAKSVTANFGLPTLTLKKQTYASGNGTMSATIVGRRVARRSPVARRARRPRRTTR